MIINKVATKYARTLLQSIADKPNFNAVVDEIEVAISLLKSSTELVKIVENPVLKSELKYSCLKAVFGEKTTQEFSEFVTFLLKKDRLGSLLPILLKFIELKDEHLGILKAEVKSAFVLDESQITAIKKKLEETTSKKIEMTVTVHPELLGGLVIETNDTLYDLSVSAQLSKLKKKFYTASVKLN